MSTVCRRKPSRWTSNLKGLWDALCGSSCTSHFCIRVQGKALTAMNMNAGKSGQQGRKIKPLGCAAAILHLVALLDCWSPLLMSTAHTNPSHSTSRSSYKSSVQFVHNNPGRWPVTNVTTPWQAAPNDCCLPVRDSGTQIGFLCWGFGKKGRR